ncbi:MAG: methyltransferase domain-containing protein [archaeon]
MLRRGSEDDTSDGAGGSDRDDKQDGADGYYDAIAPGYDRLHEEEQQEKLGVIRDLLKGSFMDDGPITPSSILDVGCGTGIGCLLFPGTPYHGVDTSVGMLDQARKRFALRVADNSAVFSHRPAEQLPFGDEEFPLVISISAVQNFDDLDKGLAEIARVCSDIAVITVPKGGRTAEILLPAIERFFKPEKIVKQRHDLVVLAKKSVTDHGRDI